MKFNRLDITFTKKREKVTYLIDISIQNNINTEHRYNNEIEKYTPLAQEIQKIWEEQKLYIVPMITVSNRCNTENVQEITNTTKTTTSYP